jgi:hypothetical protein
MTSRRGWSVLPMSIGLLLSGCATEEDLAAVAEDPSEIISGIVDHDNAAVVLLRDTANNPICSGTLVSPTVVLTSAQCARTRTVGFGVGGTSSWVRVQQFRAAPGWNGNPRDGNDLAVAILDRPVTSVVPLPIGRRAVHTPGAGAQVSIVGFGWDRTNGTGLGGRRQATASISATSDRTLTLSGVGDQQRCFGDMGGPTIATGPDGINRVVGVGSYANLPCVDGSTETRVDAYLGFIDQYVAPFDLASARSATGDFDGDGFADELVLYDYGHAAAGLWVIPGGVAGTQSVPYRVWYAAAGNFDVKQAKVSAGDFNRDGLTDLIALYDYSPLHGAGAAGLFVFPGASTRAEGASVPFRAWFGAANSFDVSQAKIAGGDFNADGHGDLVALYDRSQTNGFGAASLFVFPGTDTAETSPYEVWRGGPNSFAVAQAKVAAGDFNMDGKADLIALYDRSPFIGWAAAGLFVFPGTNARTVGSTAPREVWSAPAGSFDVSAAKVAAGDFNLDGKADLMALYDYSTGYGWAAAGLFVFPGTTESSTSPYRAWFTGPGTFDVNRAQVTAGDYDADGFTDLVALYDYTGLGVLGASLFVFPGSPAQGDSATAPRSVWSWSPTGPAF